MFGLQGVVGAANVAAALGATAVELEATAVELEATAMELEATAMGLEDAAMELEDAEIAWAANIFAAKSRRVPVEGNMSPLTGSAVLK